MYLLSTVHERNFIGGVIVSVLTSSAVDCGFIGGVMVSILSSSVVDPGFIGGVMVSILSSSAVDPGFEHRSDQTKDYKIGICCLSAKHAALRENNLLFIVLAHCNNGFLVSDTFSNSEPTSICFYSLVLQGYSK